MPTKISWTSETWNPVVGCSRVSPGCVNCYAIRGARRLERNPNEHIRSAYEGLTTVHANGLLDWSGKVNCIEGRLEQPLHWKKPRRVFVNSMSDLFHKDVPDEFIDQVFAIMALASHHVFQILTKRPERMPAYLDDDETWRRICEQSLPYLGTLPWSEPGRRTGSVIEWVERGEGFEDLDPWPLPNVHLGVSVENQSTADERIPYLLETPAVVRWLSVEPLLGPVDLMYPKTIYPNGPDMCCNGRDCGCRGLPVDPPLIYAMNGSKIDWVVVGSESGPGRRETKLEWVRDIRDQCADAGVALFVKQLDIDGQTVRDIDQFPEDLRVREYPNTKETP